MHAFTKSVKTDDIEWRLHGGLTGITAATSGR